MAESAANDPFIPSADPLGIAFTCRYCGTMYFSRDDRLEEAPLGTGCDRCSPELTA
jgi:hypothetical protein